MSKALHELLAVKPDASRRASEIEAETKKVLAEKSLFQGLQRSYTPLTEEESEFNNEPDEIVPLSYTVREKVEWFSNQISRIMNIEFQIDCTNQVAKADLVFESVTIIDIPSTYLIDLINFTDRIRNVLKKMQVLDPKFEWELDDKTEKPGVYKATRDEITYRTKKSVQHKIVTEATKEHPAQVERWNEDVRIGKYTRKLWSGAVTASDKAEMLRRCDALSAAAKKALATANQEEHSSVHIANEIFSYLLEPID